MKEMTGLAEPYLQTLLGLELSVIRYTLIAEERFDVAHDLSPTLRGALGWAMSELGCLGECPRAHSGAPAQRARTRRGHREGPERDCKVSGCPYARSFLGKGWPEQGLRVLPQSYRICGPVALEPSTYLRGDELSFELTLFGAGADYALYWTLAMIRAAARGLGGARRGFYLAEAHDRLSGALLYERGRPLAPLSVSREPLSALIAPPPEAWAPAGALELTLQTPLLLRELPERPALSILSRAVMRRLHALYARFQAPLAHPLSADELDARARAQVSGSLGWREQHRRSSSSRGAVPQSGHVGTLTYHELSSPLWAHQLLSAGALIGIGQQTNMGLGRYQLKVL